jgi:hypothetical protein
MTTAPTVMVTGTNPTGTKAAIASGRSTARRHETASISGTATPDDSPKFGALSRLRRRPLASPPVIVLPIVTASGYRNGTVIVIAVIVLAVARSIVVTVDHRPRPPIVAVTSIVPAVGPDYLVSQIVITAASGLKHYVGSPAVTSSLAMMRCTL